MIWRHRGVQIPPEEYHGIPKGWLADEIFALHRQMRGTYPISDFEIGPWGAPAWMTQRYEWLRYKETLSRVADGIRAGDAACSEIAILYIELRFIGSYSGFIREKLARALKHADLTPQQLARLNEHFLERVTTKDYMQDFHEYGRLWRHIITRDTLDRLLAHFQARLKPDSQPPWLTQLISACEARAKRTAPARTGRRRTELT